MEPRRDRRWAALLAALVLIGVGATAFLALRESAGRPPATAALEPAEPVPGGAPGRLRRHAGDVAADAGAPAAAGDEHAPAAAPDPSPRICRLDVHVADAGSRRPIPAADVAYAASDGTAGRAETDADGLVVFRDVPWSKVHVQVRADGYETFDEDVRALPLGGRTGLRVALREAWPLRVVVRDAWTRAAVPGAHLAAFRRDVAPWIDDAPPGPLVFDGTAGGDGRVTVPGVASGCLLRVSGDGLETTWTAISRTRPDASDVVVWTSPGGVVRGFVGDAGGAPVAGVTLRVAWGRSDDGTPAPRDVFLMRSPLPSAPGGVDEVWRRRTAVTDASGRYRIEGLPRGPPFLLRAHDAHGEPMTDSVRLRLGRGDAEVERDLVVDRPAEPEGIDVEYVFPEAGSEVGGAVLRGHVTDAAGEPLADVRVWIAGAAHATYTEPDGRFEIRGVVAGPCEVRAASDDHEQASVATSAPAEGLRLCLAPSAASGDDTDAGGSPRVRFVAVLVGDGPPPPELLVRTASSMTTLPWPAGARRAELETVLFTGGATAPRSLRIAGSGLVGTTVDVPPGRGSVDLGEIRLDTGLALRGTVVDDTGAPVPDAAVSVRDPDGDGRGSWARTDDRGRFAAGGLVAGRHTVGAASPRHASRGGFQVDVGAESSDVVVVLDRKVPLRVVVRDEDGLPIQGAEVAIDTAGMRPSETDRSGVADVWLAAGTHTVRAREPVLERDAPPRTVELRPGDAGTEVVLEIPRGPRR